MKMSEIHALLTRWGALTPAQVTDKAAETDPKANYQAIYNRLMYGNRTGALDRFKDANGQVMYRANPDWLKTDNCGKGGRKKAAARNMLVFLREEKKMSFAKIADQMGVSPAAVYGMYKRIQAAREKTGTAGSSMRRRIVVSMTLTGEAVTFVGDDCHPDTPREIMLYEFDPRGWAKGHKKIKSWSDVVEAFNQLNKLDQWFREGDLLIHNIDEHEGAVFGGQKFTTCRVGYR